MSQTIDLIAGRYEVSAVYPPGEELGYFRVELIEAEKQLEAQSSVHQISWNEHLKYRIMRIDGSVTLRAMLLAARGQLS